MNNIEINVAALLIICLTNLGCDSPMDFVEDAMNEQIETIQPFTDNCYWHGGAYQYIVNEDGPDHVICNDGAEFDVTHPDTIYTDLFRDYRFHLND